MNPSSPLSDSAIETLRVAGEISLVLEHGTPEEKRSMGRLLRDLRPADYREVLQSYNINPDNLD